MIDVRVKLQCFLRDRGIKQVFLSDKTGLSEAKIGAILNKNRKLDVHEFLIICDALNISPGDIIEYPAKN